MANYVLRMSDDFGGDAEEFFEERPSLEEINETCDEWVLQGDWGPTGAVVEVSWTLVELTYVESDCGTAPVEVEPDHAQLIRAATGGLGCGENPEAHEWTSDGEGGLDENPGVWSTGGTSMMFRQHCTRCGLIRTECTTGSQRNPGEHDTVEYEMPDARD